MSKKISDKNVLATFFAAQDQLVLQASDLSLETISNMVEEESIDLAPHYQRRERWDAERQSALIESFLMNIPVPPIYLSEEDFGTYSVIDGKQRMTAINSFLTGKLTLSGLESFTDINGRKFDQLPLELKNALRIRPYLRVVTLLKQSSPDLKYEVFTRLNRGGEPLNPQEIRNVLFRGKLNDRIMGIAENKFLRRQLKIKNDKSPSYQKMDDAEFVVRFLALQDTWKSFSGSLRNTLDEFMKTHQDAKKDQIDKFEADFEAAIGFCESMWGANAFKRPIKDGWRDQLLAGMYDAQMLAAIEIGEVQRAKALRNKASKLNDTAKLFSDEEFELAVRQATNTPTRIRYRIEQMIRVLKE